MDKFYNDEYEKYAQQLPSSYLKQLKSRMEASKIRGTDVTKLPQGLKSIHPSIEEAFKAEVARYSKLKNKKKGDNDQSDDKSEHEFDENDPIHAMCQVRLHLQQQELKELYLKTMTDRLQAIKAQYEKKIHELEKQLETKAGQTPAASWAKTSKTKQQISKQPLPRKSVFLDLLKNYIKKTTEHEDVWNNRLLNHFRCVAQWFRSDEPSQFKQFKLRNFPLDTDSFEEVRNRYVDFCNRQINNNIYEQLVRQIRNKPEKSYSTNFRQTVIDSATLVSKA
jgi:hypothetical protein